MRECPTCGNNQPSGTDVCPNYDTTLGGTDMRGDSVSPTRTTRPDSDAAVSRPNSQQDHSRQGRQSRQDQPPQEQPPNRQPPHGGGPSSGPHGPGDDDGFTRREMVVGGVAVIGLAAGGWVLLGDGSAPLVGGGEDNRESPESVMQAYVDALNAADVAAMADLLHEESPLDEPEEGDLSGVEDLEFTLENATVVDEEVSEVASNYDSVQEFEMIEYTIAVEGEGKTERAFVVAKNQDGEWKLWDEATTISTSTPSEDTGTESTKQVADNLNVLTEVGVVGPDNTISELRIGVQPAAGVDEINLAELTLQYVSDDEFANLLVGEDTSTGTQAEGDSDPANIQSTAGENNYLVDVIMAERDDDIVMTDSADRYELVVPLDDERAANPQPDLAVLDEGMAVEITITTEAGAQVVAFLQVPETLDEAEPGERVAL